MWIRDRKLPLSFLHYVTTKEVFFILFCFLPFTSGAFEKKGVNALWSMFWVSSLFRCSNLLEARDKNKINQVGRANPRNKTIQINQRNCIRSQQSYNNFYYFFFRSATRCVAALYPCLWYHLKWYKLFSVFRIAPSKCMYMKRRR